MLGVRVQLSEDARKGAKVQAEDGEGERLSRSGIGHDDLDYNLNTGEGW